MVPGNARGLTYNLEVKFNPEFAADEFAEDARPQGRQTYSSTSTARQQSSFGKITSPLRLQMPEDLLIHLLGEGTTGNRYMLTR